MKLRAPNISCIHRFSTRYGGISLGAFESLNLGGQEDHPDHIKTNREIFLEQCGLQNYALCNLKQNHSARVCEAQLGQQAGDALVSNKKGLVLAISVADCFPILFHDPVNHVIGAAHAGWRGTVAGIVVNTLNKMKELGAEEKNIRVAIGPGISREKFEVGEEVEQQYREAMFPEEMINQRHIDLAACNEYLLVNHSVLPQHIWKMNRCTFENDFFSYRRDKGKTGRMWAVIAL